MAPKHPAQQAAGESEPSPGSTHKRETGNTHGRQRGTEDTFRSSEASLQAALRRAESNYAQLERTQSQLRAIIDVSQEAILLLTPVGCPIKLNRRFRDFFSLDDTTVLSQSPEQLMPLLKGLFEASDSLERWLAWSVTNRSLF